MNKLYVLLYIIFLSVLSIRCGVSESMTDSVYFNSFESPGDSEGWNGLESNMFTSDSPTGYGKHSIIVGGGFIYPTAAKKISIPAEGNYILTCWAKTKTNGGSVGITNNPGNLSDKRIIQVSSKEWTQYSSNELFCPAGSEITIEIFVGGFAPSDICIDEIKIKRI